MTDAATAGPGTPAAGPDTIGAQDGLPLALLGHDLRAALSDMRAGLHLLNGLDLPAGLQAPVDRCRTIGDDLSRLIDQSVLVCLGQGSPLLAGPVAVDTEAFLSALRLRWQARAAESGHRFGLIAAGDLPPAFHIDRTALDRVLANLIANAIKHTPPCQITVTFKVSGGDLLLIVVEDEGPGFDPAHLPSLERDFTLPPGASRAEGGLGLQSVRHLIRAMGGRCNARNKSAGGAEIGLCLPLAEAPAEPPASLAVPPDLTGTHLLYADDSAASRELVCALARNLGATIRTVADGDAAIAALNDGPLPDVAILDDEMPGQSGRDVLGWLRAQGGVRAGLPVLALTSHIGAEELAALRHAGANEVLSKPLLCPLELGRAIRRAQGRDDSPITAPSSELRTLNRLRDIAGPEAAEELFARLQEDLIAARSGLSEAACAGDIARIRAHSHVIIALAGTAGAMGLHEDAVTLNSMTHDHEPAERIIALAERLDGSIGHLLDTVRQAAPPRDRMPT